MGSAGFAPRGRGTVGFRDDFHRHLLKPPLTLQRRPGVTLPRCIEIEARTPKWVAIDYAGNVGWTIKVNFTIRTASYLLQLRISAIMISHFGDRDQSGRWCCAMDGL